MKQVNRIIDGQLVQIDVWESCPGLFAARAWLSKDAVSGWVVGVGAGDAQVQMGRLFSAEMSTAAAAVAAVCEEIEPLITPALGSLSPLLASMIRGGEATLHCVRTRCVAGNRIEPLLELEALA